MKRAKLDGTELAYEVTGTGEPLLLIGPGPIADSFFPLLTQPALAGRHRLISYHQRGQGSGTRRAIPVSFAEHAADAAALLDDLGVRRAHVAGHSTGGDIALQLALDRPDLVGTLVLLEPALMFVPSAATFLENVAPAVERYGSGDREGAMAAFLSVACSLEWDSCRRILEERVPGGVARVMNDADAFFGSYLPALGEWRFDDDDAATISQPVLSVLGTESERLFVDGNQLLHSWFPRAEDCTIERAAHLLHLQQPEAVARGIAGFLARHPLTARSGRELRAGTRAGARAAMQSPAPSVA